jgi:hypothetical protein
MLRFWKYGLYAFLRFALFKERRSQEKGRLPYYFEGEIGKGANQNRQRVKLK